MFEKLHLFFTLYKKIQAPSSPAAIFLILLCGLPLRVLFHHAYYPWWAGDSGGYFVSGCRFFSDNISLYDGGRTPLYPFFLYLAEYFTNGPCGPVISPAAAALATTVQSALGALVAVMLFFIALFLNFDRKTACLIGIFVSINPTIITFERMILSESLSLFMLVASALLVVRGVRHLAGKQVIWTALIGGLTAGLSTLARPNNLVFYIIFIAALMLAALLRFLKSRQPVLPMASYCGALGFGMALPLIAWLAFNDGNTGRLTLTPLADLTTSFAAYNLFGDVQPQDKILGSIMEQGYLETNRQGVTRRDYLWTVIPKLYAVENAMPYVKDPQHVGDVQLAHYIGTVSSGLLQSHPRQWLANGLSDFKDTFIFDPPLTRTWNVTDPRRIGGGTVVKHVISWRLASALAVGFKIPLLLCYLLSWAALPLAFIRLLLSRTDAEADAATIALALSAGVLVSFIAPCFLAAYYPRFAVPFYPFLVLLAVFALQTCGAFMFSMRWRTKPLESTVAENCPSPRWS